PIRGEEFCPVTPRLHAARADTGREVLTDTVGHEKLSVLGPSVAALGEAALLLAKRLPVGGGGILLVRGAVADVAVENNECGTTRGFSKDPEGVLDAIEVIGVANAQHIPPITEEAGGDILAEGDACIALDGDVIVVIDPAEVVEAQMTSQ